MNWLKRLFSGKGYKATPAIADGKIESVGLTTKPGPDILARQGGQKRNRVHIYRQPFGYPIRLCDWIFVDLGQIEEKGRCIGINGPADDIRVLAAALDWREYQSDRICKNCKAVATGKRAAVLTIDN